MKQCGEKGYEEGHYHLPEGKQKRQTPTELQMLGGSS